MTALELAVTPETFPPVVDPEWTDVERQRALEHEVRDVVTDFFLRSVPRRLWEPWRDLPIDEMHNLRGRLSDDTIHLLEGFMGVEEYIGDYVLHGLESLPGAPTRRRLLLQWGAEETRHGAALREVLLHTGARTPEQLDEYDVRLTDRRWRPTQHRGVDSPASAIVYTTFQERATYVNYVELRRRVRAEYGLPDGATPAEVERGREIGVSEALHRIALDEVAHHAIFLSILRIQLRYFPERTLRKITEIVDHFTMPALRLIPSRRQFIAAVLRTRIYSEDRHEAQVVRPTLKHLGVEDRPSTHGSQHP